MAPSTERTLKTLAYGWIVGSFIGAFCGWMLVPATLSVEYLTPIVVAGPFAGLIAGGIGLRFNAVEPRPTR
jgi:branched-subunit amino acid ABC-type transport system permease component